MNELDLVLPHSTGSACAFKDWLTETPHFYFLSLAEAFDEWLNGDGTGNGAHHAGGEYASWLETVIYIVMDWSADPSKYPYLATMDDGQHMLTIERLAPPDHHGEWRFLVRGFFSAAAADARTKTASILARRFG